MTSGSIFRALLPACGLYWVAAGSISQALASWSGYKQIDPGEVPVFSDYSCASPSQGVAVCAALNNDHLLRVLIYSNGSWSEGPTLGNLQSGPPSCASAGGGLVACGTNQGIDLAFEVPGKGEFSASSGDVMVGPPSCVAIKSGFVFCAATTSDRGIAGFVYEPNTSLVGLATRLGQTLYSPAGCAEDGLGHAICGWVAANANIIVGKYLGIGSLPPRWTATVNLGGVGDSPFSCAYTGVPGAISCYGLSRDHYAYGNSYSGGTWSTSGWTGWGPITTSPAGGIGCSGQGMVLGAPGLVCVYIGATDNQLYGVVGNFNGALSQPHAFGLVNGQATAWTGIPSCATIDYSTQPPRTLCVMRRVNNGKFYSVIGP